MGLHASATAAIADDGPNKRAPRHPNALLKITEVSEITNISRSFILERVKSGKFPPPAIRDGRKFTRWRLSDVEQFLRDPHQWLSNHREIEGAGV